MKEPLLNLLFLLLTGFALALAPQRPALTEAKPESAGFSPDRLTRLDRVIGEYVEEKKIPGAVALVARNGKIDYHKAFGQDDGEARTPLKRDAIFRIASQTKAVTSVAAMMLFEEGRFLPDEPVSRYIPAFRNPKVPDKFNEKDSSYTTLPARSEITIRQLLTHTSGISYPTIGTKEANAIYAKAKISSGIGTPNDKLADAMNALAALLLVHQPGEKWTYGLNTDVPGYLVEVLSGMTLDQFFRTRIFESPGMKDTYL